MAAAVPTHSHGHAFGLQDRVVGDCLVEREQRVDGSLEKQSRDVDFGDSVARTLALKPCRIGVAELPVRSALIVGIVYVRVEVSTLGEVVERTAPTSLVGMVFVEPGNERMPRNRGCDGIDAAIDGRQNQLDSATVGPADHAQTWVTRVVELHSGLRSYVVNECLNIFAFEVSVVDHGVAGRLTEATRVPRQHAVPSVVEVQNIDVDEKAAAVIFQVGVAGPAPPRALQYNRQRFGRGGCGVREPMGTNHGAVE